MKTRVWTILSCAVVLAGAGCAGFADLLNNLSEERAGNVSITFINNTAFRASFTAGTWDDLDRGDPPSTAIGAVTTNQQAIEASLSSGPINLTCARDFAIGTADLAQRIVDTNRDEGNNFNDDLFIIGVNFSSAPLGSDAANLPTAGSAVGVALRLGVDYSCQDEILVTFEEDGNVAGGFRIDIAVLRSLEDN